MEKRRHGRPNQVLGRLNSNGEIEGESSLGLVTGAWILQTRSRGKSVNSRQEKG